MKMMKGVLAALVAVFVSHAGLAASGTETVGDYTWSWKTSSGGGVVITAVDPQPSGELTIPTQLNSEAVVELQSSLFYNAPITAVTIPGTVRKIGANAFYGTALETVEVPASVTYIDSSAFAKCTSLTSVTLNEGLVTIEQLAFFEDTALTTCDLPSSVRSLGKSAFTKTALTSIALSDGLKEIEESVFCSCKNLTTVTIPEGVETLNDSAFSECDALTSVQLPSTLRKIGQSCFYRCKKLGTAAIPANIAEIGRSAFYETLVTEVDLPDTLTRLGERVFDSCEELTRIDFGNGLAEIPAGTCDHCLKLASVRLPKQVRTIGEKAFETTRALRALDIPASVRTIGERAFALETRNSAVALSLRFAGDRPELMGVGAYGVFCGANGFVTAYVPETDSWSAELSAGKWDLANVKPIAEHSDSFSDFTYQMSDSQYYVTGVNSTPPAGAWLVVPATHSTYPVTAIAPDAFKDLTQVSAIVLPDSIRTIAKRAFDGCTGLGELILPASVTTLYATALTNCTSLASVTFKGSMPSVMGASGLYDGLPESLVTYASWETDYASWKTAVANGTWNGRPIAWARPVEEAWAQGVAVYRSDLAALVFYADGKDHSSEGPLYLLANAEAKETGGVIVMPWAGHKANVTRVIFDASFASARPKHCAKWFDGFTQLASVDGLEYLDVSEATSLRRMFAGCTALTTLNLANFDTSAVTDMSDMFAGCSSLTTIYALNTFVTTALESDTQNLFTGCTALVGGNGFAYDAGKVTAAYAKINDSETDGYLSRPRRAVVVYSSGQLTFYYDAVDRSVLEQWNKVFAIEDLVPTNLPWVGEGKYVVAIEFDASFADYRPTSCENWFANAGASSIKGLANLDVSQATSLAGMFSNCYALVELDLTHFETPAVTNIAHMFSNCGNLTTIYASSHFTTNLLMCGAEPVFDGSTKLVGGAGAAYDSQKVSAAYAHIGTATTPDGYFTEPRPIAKAVYDSTQAKMTFYYDMLDHEAEGEVFQVAVASATSKPAWYDETTLKSSVTEVVFDASFADYRPTICFRWFHGFTALTTLTGLENLNVSEATTLKEMFARCNKLTTLDLSSFDTHKVTTMNNMFYQCYDLVTIYASTDFVTTALTTPTEAVFDTCTNLVGGAGTAYKTTTNPKRATYACIDDPLNSKPGYFTERGRTAVAVVATDGKTLSFYWDSADHSSEGTVYPIADAEAQDPSVSAPWSGAAGTVTNVVFARSFANYAPQHCGSWFSGFKKLAKIDGLANLNLGQATSLKNMFYNCSALTALDFSDASVGSKVTDCFGMFSGCSGLTALNLRRFITGAVTDMTKMFNGCSSLTTLDLYSFQTANVTSMMNMFADCSALETILVSGGFATSGLADASKPVFYGCTALTGGAGSVCDGYENRGFVHKCGSRVAA